MAATTFEEAKLCPRCKKPGEEASKVPARDMKPGTVVYVIFCRTPGCRWENTSWLIQVNPDGSIPTEDYSKREKKTFPVSESAAQQARDIERAVARERELQQRGGGEVRNPYS